MSSTSQHAPTHSIPQAQRAPLPPLHSREHSASYRPGSSMSISSMLGTDTDSARNRPSLPPIPASQSSPVSNGNGIQDFRSWNESRTNRAYSNNGPPRPYSSATHTEQPRFGPPLPGAMSQSPPSHRPTFQESHSPTHSSFNFRRASGPPPYDPRPMQEQFGPHLPPAHGYENGQAVRYNGDSRPPEPLTQSPVKVIQEREDVPQYPFLPKAPPSYAPVNTAPVIPERPPFRSFDSRSERQSSSPELSRHPRENGLKSLQEIRRDSAGTPDPLSTPRGSPLLRRSFAMVAQGSEDGSNSRVTDILSDDKRGRASPLPQAVQGAQAQSKGPTNEPGIKNEFARMFSGIGSGVGSAVSTPVPQEAQLAGSVPPSPLDVDGRGTPLGKRGSLDRPRDSSRAGKRRRAKDDDVKREEDVGVSLARTLSGRGQKRTRNNYQDVSAPPAQRPHHHHIHHHHHHHHALEAGSKKAGTPVQGNPTTAPHHHHHIHHHHHHHNVQSPFAMPINRKPQFIVKSKAVYEQIRKKPRMHLGSMLYQARIEAPSDKPDEHTKLGYTATSRPIPKFEDKDNCTFTIRVPRTYLQRAARQEITERRFLWGVDIYTDDSDPIAALIHGGWIRGEWADDVDLSLIGMDDIEPAKRISTEISEMGLPIINAVRPAPRPMVPIPGRDLHITILLLPRLVSYGSSTSYGIRSREWNGRHDGVSYKIEKIAWIDEGLSRGQERGGQARRDRMNATMIVGKELNSVNKISTTFTKTKDAPASSPLAKDVSAG